MKITLSPVRHDAGLTVTREGSVLAFNGQPIDLAKGETCDWIVGPPVLGPEGWEVTVILPHGPDAPEETLFPAPVTMAGDGAVPLPPWGAPDRSSAAGAEGPGPEGWTTHD